MPTVKKKEDTVQRLGEGAVKKPFPMTWFEAQFGKRPKGDVVKLQQEHRRAVAAMMCADMKLQAIEIWEKRLDAAIKAWTAHER